MLSACGEAHIDTTMQWSLRWHRARVTFWYSLAPCGTVLSSHTVLLVGVSVSSPQAELCCESLSV